MERTNSVCEGFTGTSSAVKILDSDPTRDYICFYAVSGACEIAIGDATFADVAITLQEGVMWEPKVVLTGEVYFKGDGSKLSVIH